VSLYEKWVNQTLTQEDIERWLLVQNDIRLLLDHGVLNEVDIKHVAMCLHHIFLWYHDKISLGHFLTAVVKNDLIHACGSADNTNRLCLPVYISFLYNYAPMDYRLKAKNPDSWHELHQSTRG